MREVIQVQSIKAQELEPGIGYIRIRQFQERTAPDLVAALEKFDKGGKLAGLIAGPAATTRAGCSPRPWRSPRSSSATAS